MHGRKDGDPYDEIYKVSGKWYSLLREAWINPCNLKSKDGGGDFQRTCEYLDLAKNFHKIIVNTFHSNSYVHYGADRKRRSFGEVVWEIKNCADHTGWQNWPIVDDTRQGTLDLVRWRPTGSNTALMPFGEDMPDPVCATINRADAPGDQTVPVKSADHQLSSMKMKAVFRQTGYEHQSSCKDPNAVASMLYSIVRIASGAIWKC